MPSNQVTNTDRIIFNTRSGFIFIYYEL